MRYYAVVVALLAGVVATLAISFSLPIGVGSGTPSVGPAIAWSAGAGEKGAVQMPDAACDTDRIVAKVRTKVRSSTADTTLADVRYEGRPSDDQRLRRAEPDTYEVRTEISCGVKRAESTQVVTVATKTPTTTIDPSEFARIQVGMTRDEVAAIVGYGGRVIGKRDDAPNQTRQYEEEPLFAYAAVTYRDGLVTAKKFDAQNK